MQGRAPHLGQAAANLPVVSGGLWRSNGAQRIRERRVVLGRCICHGGAQRGALRRLGEVGGLRVATRGGGSGGAGVAVQDGGGGGGAPDAEDQVVIEGGGPGQLGRGAILKAQQGRGRLLSRVWGVAKGSVGAVAGAVAEAPPFVLLFNIPSPATMQGAEFLCGKLCAELAVTLATGMEHSPACGYRGTGWRWRGWL